MNIKTFLGQKDNLTAENRLLRFAVVIIGCTVIFNSFMIHAALNRQSVVLIPPGLDKKVEVSGGQLDSEYVRTFARYVTTLALTYDPIDVRSRFDDLLLLFDAEFYKDYYKSFYDLAGIVESKNVSSVFYITQPIHVDSVAKTIEVEGLNRRYKDNLKLDENVKKYVIKYRVEDGKFKIVNFDEKEK